MSSSITLIASNNKKRIVPGSEVVYLFIMMENLNIINKSDYWNIRLLSPYIERWSKNESSTTEEQEG